MGVKGLVLAVGLAAIPAQVSPPRAKGAVVNVSPVEYPPGTGFFNVKDYGARGDGTGDDTASFQKAIKAVQMHFQIIYVPNGTYLLTDTISWGAWITFQGQSQEKTILRLKDACPGYDKGAKPVLRCMFNNNMSFSNYIRNLTVDTGRGNPGAVGVRYNTHNHGVLEDVTIRSGDSKGAIGLDMAETEFGPGMVRNVIIEGFDVGIRTPGQPSSAVFEHVTLRNQNVVGFENSLPVSVRDLLSVNKVPAIRNAGHPMAHLMLIDADLSGGAPGVSAIENKGRYYLRNVRSAGYRSVMDDNGRAVAGGAINERFAGESLALAEGARRHLNLPVREVPPTPVEPAQKWVVPDLSGADDTAPLQKAIDSGAATVCLPSNNQAMVSDTIVVRGNVKRIVALKHHHGNIRAKNPDAFAGKPMLRIEGKGAEPLVIESVGVSCWPKDSYAIVEVASTRPVVLKYVWCGGVNIGAGGGGDVFIDEGLSDLRIGRGENVFIRQHNPENNPFDPKNPRFPRTYVVNRGANLWVLGMKTESPAVHVVTLDGGRTEVLGGFFRDHFGPTEYKWKGDPPLPNLDMSTGVPYFVTQDAATTASYLQYAWGPGKARSLQGVEIRGGQRKDLTFNTGTFAMSLYGGVQ